MNKKYTSQESYYARMKKLADVKGTSVNESQTRNLGTLIDIEKAANGVAYGIIKEQHKYYIKKGGLNENQTVADFVYIGGLGNVTDFEYTKLAEARKNRNMMLKTINEGLEIKPMKSVGKKGMLIEGKAEQEIEMASNKLGDLDAATAAAEVPAEPAMPAPDAEMDAGIDAMDAPAEEMPVDDMGADPLAGGDMGGEMPVDDMGADPLAGDAELGGDEEAVAVEDPETEIEREIEKSLGKITNQLRKTELTDSQVKSYVNTFLSAFKDKFPDIDIEDRKAMAEKITKVVPPEDIEDLGQNVEDTETSDEIMVSEPEEEVAEQQCAECGGFAQYAESRGYNVDSVKECGEEEMTNMVSGYANAHDEGQNDGDFKAVALFITPEILAKLKGEYGHDEYANQVEPFSMEMNETSAEDKDAQINELFGNLGRMMKGAAGKVAGDVKQGVQKVGTAIGDKATQIGTAIGDKATQAKDAVSGYVGDVKKAAHSAVVPAEVKKLEGVAANLGKQITALNNRLVKAGKEKVDLKRIMTAISQEVGASQTQGGIGGLGLAEDGIPVDSTEVMPPAMEEEVNIKVSEKAGKKLSSDNVPQVEMKENDEKEGEDIDIENLDVDAEEAPAEDNVLDLTKHEEPEMNMISGFESMGGGVVKPEGAEITTVEVTKDSVSVTMNESEAKLRKYIRNRLEEKAGLKKPVLTETKKSATLQKLDRTIDKQFELFESQAVNEIMGFSVPERFAKLNPQDAAGIEKLFKQAFQNILINPQMGAIGRAAKTTPPELKYEILQQFVDGNGGTLRLGGDFETVRYEPEASKAAAIPSKFRHGGTQGKTQLGGV